ncbi:hypothetical protein AAEH92_17220 [Shewanella xiamenensis]|uniref:hypothetical protein n=1 Tax=Shewanella xiamenensis TaxID=332186 RepID=UPI00313A79E9
MNNKILIEAKEDIPLFFNDFKTFWDESLKNITDEHITEVYKGTLIFKNWKNSLHSIEIKNLDTLINELFEDINSSLYLAFLGQYRTSYMHMRSSIELAFQLLYFIHHPIEYSQWKNGAFIIKFIKLTEYLEKHPLLSQNNILTTLLAQISRKWTHCSKHIHGESPIFFQCIKDTRKPTHTL